MDQYDKFLSYENFELAYQRLKTAPRNLYKSIYYEDLKNFSLFKDDYIENIIKNIKDEIYSPDKCYKIFIPKKGNFVRPLSMLSFIDLLVYQAIVNVVVDVTNHIISPYYENTIFGSIPNTSLSKEEDRIFFFKSWKKRWKKFNEISKINYNDGYIYLSEFDIASFFDTIDHHILCELLRDRFGVDERVLTLLNKCLEEWTQEDATHKTFKSKHGIPQGTISSSFLAELYLFYIDEEVRRLAKKQDYKYLRYVDDIRISCKDEITAQKMVSLLDLISRDLGLIPQSSKILIKKIDNIDKELKSQNSKLSEITKEYNEDNEGKPKGKLKSKTHKKLKKRFLDCFSEGSDEVFLDKTIIGYSLFKLNADEDVLDVIISHRNNLMPSFEGVLFYFKKHFKDHQKTLNFIKSILHDENIIFHHIIALVFKFFPEYPFDSNIYSRYFKEKHRHWLVNYYMMDWLFINNKRNNILLFDDSNITNYILKIKINQLKYEIIKDDEAAKSDFIDKLLTNKIEMVALQGLAILFKDDIFSFIIKKSQKGENQIVKYICNNEYDDIIVRTLAKDFSIDNANVFFNEKIWSDAEVYTELKKSFIFFYRYRDIDPTKSLMNLNGFNNLIFDKICNIVFNAQVKHEYGVDLDANIIGSKFYLCNEYWKEINSKRNQHTDAHVYDKTGKIRKRVTASELKSLISKEKKALEQICDYFAKELESSDSVQ